MRALADLVSPITANYPDPPLICPPAGARWLSPHSLVLVVDLLLGQRRLGVLLQMMANPVERVHLLGAAGRHGALISAVAEREHVNTLSLHFLIHHSLH